MNQKNINTTEEKIDISVIIPAHNSERTIERAINSALSQISPRCSLEVIVVDDGSSDSTFSVCEHSFGNNSNVVLVHQDNMGVAAARNNAMDIARGRYISFLDSDDYLKPATLDSCIEFFDIHYSETDVVTYPMIINAHGKKRSHVREEVLDKTGVYDLTRREYAFSLITNVNVVIKNSEQTPRFNEELIVHEDEQFLMSILLRKQTVGFCKAGAYCYEQNSSSAINTKMHPFYQFENNIGFWEEFFSQYKIAPIYLQASFLNEINWKTREDVLFPYHYSPEDFSVAYQRIRNLMKKVEDELIINCPRSDKYLNQFFLNLKYDTLDVSISSKGTALSKDGTLLEFSPQCEAILYRTRFDSSGNWIACGTLKSTAFSYLGKPSLFLIEERVDGGDVTTRLELTPSSRSRHRSHIQTNSFWNFRFKVHCGTVKTIAFTCELLGNKLPMKFRFSTGAQFSWANKSLTTVHQGISVTFCPEAKIFAFSNNLSRRDEKQILRTAAKRMFSMNKVAGLVKYYLPVLHKKTIWLYHDRTGVGKDNSYYQFLHDFYKNDGVDRYYVTGNSPDSIAEMFPDSGMRKNVIPFASSKHKILHLRADKIIASYIEPPNWRPFSAKTIARFADVINYEVVYLQHGVLHAHMPWKYSADRLGVDREVVSSQFEVDNLVNNYGFSPDQLIPSGMPRYDMIESPERKQGGLDTIVLAPSWRKYLVEEAPDLSYKPVEHAFLQSTYWRETSAFLKSEGLLRILRSNHIQLRIKLHPIFSVYKHEFEALTNDMIVLTEEVSPQECDLLITDYSSYVFDYVYAGCDIAYFFPDLLEFQAGLNGYHELDLPLADAFGEVVTSHRDLLALLEKKVRGECDNSKCASKAKTFFLYHDNKQRDRLYDALIQDLPNC